MSSGGSHVPVTTFTIAWDGSGNAGGCGWRNFAKFVAESYRAFNEVGGAVSCGCTGCADGGSRVGDGSASTGGGSERVDNGVGASGAGAESVGEVRLVSGGGGGGTRLLTGEDIRAQGSGGDIVGGAVAKGKWWAHNKKKKQMRKEKKMCGVSDAVRAAREEAAVAKGKLAAARAEHELELLKARDVDEEKKAQNARLKKVRNRDMVAIEKAFSELRAAGDVPGCVTVVSEDGRKVTRDENGKVSVHDMLMSEIPSLGESISPDSSASQHEFRMAQKRILELEKEVRDMRHAMEFEKLERGAEAAFTLDTSGSLAPSVKGKLEEVKRKGAICEQNYTIPGTLFVSVSNLDEVRQAEVDAIYEKNPPRRICSDGKERKMWYSTEDGSVYEKK